jgi:hypothetical protein
LKAITGTPNLIYFYDSVNNQSITLTNQWVRYEYTFTAASTTSVYCRFVLEAGTSTSADFVAWGAQLVEGSTAKDYQKTETRLNIPRLDYSNGTCPSLLVEPQRTNLLTYSSSFDNAAWVKTRATITANTAVSPDGTTTADLYTDGTFTNNYGFIDTPISSTIGSTYTLSVFVKAATSPFITIGLYDTQDNGVLFNTTTNATTTFGTISNVKVDSYENGWYRVSFTRVVTRETIFPNFSVRPTNSFTSYNGTASLSALFWGAQLEAGSYATSYIPTTSASVTRNADVISKSGISSLFGSTYTIFGEYINQNVNNTRLLTLKIPSASLYDNFITIYQNGTALTATGNNAATAEQFSITSGSYALGQKLKFALRCENNNVAFYINGTQIGTDTNASIPAVSAIYVGNYLDVFGVSVIFSVDAWPNALTNTQLAQLTTI